MQQIKVLTDHKIIPHFDIKSKNRQKWRALLQQVQLSEINFELKVFGEGAGPLVDGLEVAVFRD